ncbi:uncharacterized protein involved in exopolysaccharide biosynthesis [Mucilaginibacter gracilis]|uniref:Uncharacterized protein involved in exopolysaccharide biosynthesis n=1 Tax=Mucilaginibacter gracilis TaxID=423350 RepID=A0A495J8Z4_9SPHI|nr:AAA family ATPase [Mucilaginibacter gracilis]RKR85480.1 uncharacterized protein involved in exopolysaccharide biosynthesis [Mucilaginibacter gracilis]
MELKDFVSLLKRYKLILIILPSVAIVATYFYTRKLPDVYTSQTQISTGIVDQSQKLPDEAVAGESQIFIQFSNIMTMMKMNRILNQVSYQLILHDLTSREPFRKPSKLFKDLNPSARAHAIEVYTKLYNVHGLLQSWDEDQRGLSSVISSMQYDPGSIQSKMTVYRNEASDYIHIDYSSDNPQLSAFVVNTIVKEFITYYTSSERENQLKAVRFLDSLLAAKKYLMDVKRDSLKRFKIDNHILDITNQAASLYNQIADLDNRKQQADAEVASNSGAIREIDNKFNPHERKNFENFRNQVNAKITRNKDLQKTFVNSWVKSSYNPYYQAKVDSIQRVIDDQISQTIDETSDNPASAKASLQAQKMDLEIKLNLARYSISTFNGEITKLRSQLDLLVPLQAKIQEMEKSLDDDSKEYLELLAKDNQASVTANFSSKLRQVELATPGGAEASKKMLLTIAAGIIVEIFCILILFILFYLDDSIRHPKTLANKTGLPVLGYLNVIKGSTLDLKKIWEIENRGKMQQFKDLLRSIRFEIDQELHGNKILAITSLGDGDGKTLLAISLAYSYSIINKRVLLIDGNFSNPTISKTVQPKLFIEDYFRDDPDYKDVILNTSISVLGNHGSDITLLEIENERIIQQKFSKLKSMYDIIIIEVQDMDKMNKAKEWLLFADKTIAVFEARQSLDENRKASVKYFASLGSKFAGWIFNKATAEPYS